MAKKSKRLFFAIKLDEDARDALLAAQGSLTAAYKRLVPPENFHLTLAFIGNADADYQQCIEMAADKVQAKPFSICLNHYGYFAKVKIFWVGLSANNVALTELHQQLNRLLVPCGFQPAKKFVPHITLLRKAEMVTTHEEIPSVECVIDRFFLVQSIPTEGGVRYQPLSEYIL